MKPLDVALHVAGEFGWLVFPVHEGRKVPCISGGFNSASNDPAQIAAWGAQFKNCNFGLATGLESGVGVIDIDGPAGEDWYESHFFDDGLVVTTPSGGKHIYFTLVDETEYKSSRGELHHEVDTRFDGGYALLPGGFTDPEYGVDQAEREKLSKGTYEGDLSSPPPDLPAEVAEILPLRYHRPGASDEKVYLDSANKPDKPSPGEERVIEQIKKQLDDLPRPWVPNAGYNDVGFRMACWLWEIVQSDQYAMTEKQAEEFFFANAPSKSEDLLRQRWLGAKKKTDGHPAEPPGDVPPLLDPQAILDPEKYELVDKLYWETTKRRDLDLLIRECRRQGFTMQQAYSLATYSKANKLPNGQRAAPQWGRVKRVYAEVPTEAEMEVHEAETEVTKADVEEERRRMEEKSLRGKFLSDAERDIVDRTPNFIDLYVEVAKELHTEPNLPLAYLNAWAALSSMLAGVGYLALKQKRYPISLYFLPMSESGSGKGDLKADLLGVFSAYPQGGVGRLAPFGRKASPEAIEKILVDRGGQSVLLMVDENAELLAAMHSNGRSYMSGVMDMILDVYDGKITQSARVGHDMDEYGKTVRTNFNVWLQGTYIGVTEELTERDVHSGFVGRFIPAVGWPAKFTEESLALEFADEYQDEMGGENPLLMGLGEELAAIINMHPGGSEVPVKPDNQAALDRLNRFRVDAKLHIDRLPMHKELQPIITRLTLNVAKAACLIALSDGRKTFTISDVLIAIKSGERWIGTMIQVNTAILAGELRRKVNKLIEFVAVKPRPRHILLKSRPFSDWDEGDLDRILRRAENEGSIESTDTGWRVREKK